jgi:uncharacterized membrane protein YdjX (TVP38/TMEM64 family)
MSHRKAVMALWIALLIGAFYLYAFHRDALQALLLRAAESPPAWVYVVYLALGCIRGFTLIPATYLVVAGMLVLPPLPLYALTMIGVIISSAAVYYFAEAMHFDEFFERRYGPQVAKLRAVIRKRELPIVIAWSFFPIAPTDLVCYVCGALRVDVKKCLLGVTVGEGAICAIYIFLGRGALSFLR